MPQPISAEQYFFGAGLVNAEAALQEIVHEQPPQPKLLQAIANQNKWCSVVRMTEIIADRNG